MMRRKDQSRRCGRVSEKRSRHLLSGAQPGCPGCRADKAIQADPTSAIAYYLKGNGLIANTTVDPKTQKMIPPPGCLEAYQKYLDLAPTGLYASEVKAILASFAQKVDTTYKAPKPAKK